jgi:hypothetical protein
VFSSKQEINHLPLVAEKNRRNIAQLNKRPMLEG